MADETPDQPVVAPKGFFRALMSCSPDASYGRMISAAAFVAFLTLHVLFSVNPQGIFTAVGNQPQVLQYLFILVISGYSVTSAKEIIPQISTLFAKKTAAPVVAPTVGTDNGKADS